MAHNPIPGWCPFYDGTYCHTSIENKYPSQDNKNLYCQQTAKSRDCSWFKGVKEGRRTPW